MSLQMPPHPFTVCLPLDPFSPDPFLQVLTASRLLTITPKAFDFYHAFSKQAEYQKNISEGNIYFLFFSPTAIKATFLIRRPHMLLTAYRLSICSANCFFDLAFLMKDSYGSLQPRFFLNTFYHRSTLCVCAAYAVAASLASKSHIRQPP